MSSLRTLLLALLLPVLVLPDGMLLCLRRLVGEAEASTRDSCCTRCCDRDAAPEGPVMRELDPRCMHCCIVVPATDRSIDTAPRKCEDALAPALVLAPPPQSALLELSTSLWRPLSDHDPGFARAAAPPITLPLRL